MGYALAVAAVERGAHTVLISGPTCLAPPIGVEVIRFETNEQLHRAVKQHFSEADCLVMAAAPADFRPSAPANKKIKRAEASLQIRLEPTEDIIEDVAAKKRSGQLVIGFALETDKGLENARKKLQAKHLDMVILNRVGQHTGFESDTNEVTLLEPGKQPEEWDMLTKSEIANRLLDKLVLML